MRHFLIVTNMTKDTDLSVTNQIRTYIEAHGGICDTYLESQMLPQSVLPDHLDCAIVLGGDGTLLWAVGALGREEIPVIGINMGTVGFMAEVEQADTYAALDALMQDEYQIEERLMLEGQLIRNGKVIHKAICINDVAICRSGFSRIIQIEVMVNKHLMDVYGADGVVISTPTGSTGYSLSAGGPVVSPNTNAIIVTPISPHSLSARSIVLPGEDEVTIAVGRIRKSQTEEAFVTFDGQYGSRVMEEDFVVVRKAQQTTKLVKVGDLNFFDVLRSKIGGK